jgi:hypothetical protein
VYKFSALETLKDQNCLNCFWVLYRGSRNGLMLAFNGHDDYVDYVKYGAYMILVLSASGVSSAPSFLRQFIVDWLARTFLNVHSTIKLKFKWKTRAFWLLRDASGMPGSCKHCKADERASCVTVPVIDYLGWCSSHPCCRSRQSLPGNVSDQESRMKLVNIFENVLF